MWGDWFWIFVVAGLPFMLLAIYVGSRSEKARGAIVRRTFPAFKTQNERYSAT
jgi:hypothetical protein